MARRAASLLVCLLALGALAPATVRADGDPASDTLLGQNVFLPYQPAVTDSVAAALDAEVAAARRAGLPIKVALIGSRVDLGAIPQLFGKPQPYADFLEREISFDGPVPLLVVMADGYGVQAIPHAAGVVAVLPLPASGSSDALARAATVAVARLADAAGHPVARVAAPPTDGSGDPGAGNGSTAALAAAVAGAAVLLAAGLMTLRRRRVIASRRISRRRQKRPPPRRRAARPR